MQGEGLRSAFSKTSRSLKEVVIDEEKKEGRKGTLLLHSSERAGQRAACTMNAWSLGVGA